MEKTSKTQAERILNAFNEIAHNVTAEDKSQCMSHLNIPKSSLWRMMHEEIKDVDKAINVLMFFKKRISEREKALQKAVA